MESFSKIYVHVIDGTDVWIPVNAKHIELNRFQLLSSDDFDPDDKTILFEFIPGDIVEVVEKKFKDGTSANAAFALVTAATHIEKEYLELLYRIVCGKVSVESLRTHKHLERLKSDIEKGILIYPTIIKTLENIDT